MVTIRLDGLGAFHGARLVLSDVSTPIFRGGEVVAVIGPNAAGKSTLFKRIAGLLKGPGRVCLEGAAKGPDGICYMPQDTAANAVLTVYESILLARKQGSAWSVSDGDLALIDGILAALSISDLAFRNVGELSGGQRQVVSIAQILAREPEILLMDEPTSALDLHRQVEVLTFMRGLARKHGIAVLIAIHDLNQALRFADKCIVIAEGRMVACGTPEDVVTPALLRDVYRVEARIERCSRGIGHVMVDGVAAETAATASIAA
ncbi:ABC transporter ATP-binding protein [Mesorhizobium sp. L48C026A00]|uniref:ABC transporter ATP-binding protein n=1 Tax=Mesorhizobium sp. L48C026A00 TaxID=1287182 RepID=UPI0003CFFF87|nr:ABC transporter ATP-binding protein [Mesorhizobium sp. L48C026A00]ESZ19254.1 ferrichrome ABC transporter [Mesorhizobium sp. L48C026A00]